MGKSKYCYSYFDDFELGSNIKLSYSYLGGFELKLQYQFQLFVQLAIHTFAILDEAPITNSAILTLTVWS